MLAARLASRGRCLAARQARTLATGSYRIAGGNVPAQDPIVDMNLGRTPEGTAELERLAGARALGRGAQRLPVR